MSETNAEAHPREEFDGYAAMVALGDWGYEVDDYGVAYGSGRWFPFARSVRLAPDLDYRSWRNEYVLLWPGPSTHEATARLTIALRAQGMGAFTVRVDAGLGLRGDGVVTLRPDDLTGQVRDAALVKAGRVLDLLHRERRRRRASAPGPITAHDRDRQRCEHAARENGDNSMTEHHKPRPRRRRSGWRR